MNKKQSAVSTRVPKKGKATLSGHREYTTAEIVDALFRANGIVSHAAELLGCSRDTIYKRRNDLEIKEAIASARYYAVDEAEKALHDLVKNREPSAVFFTLKTLGKGRGYVERQEHTGADGGPIELVDARSALARRIAGHVTAAGSRPVVGESE